MKNVTLNLFRATLLAVALSLAPAYRGLAQDQAPQGQAPPETRSPQAVVPLKDTEAVQKVATGNITEITPAAIFIKAVGDAHPMGYTITTNTAYVDDGGSATERANAKVGRAVIITYVDQGNDHVALSIHVRNAP